MDTIRELYDAEDIGRLEKKIRNGRGAMLLLGCTALALCVALCCLTRTGNAERMELLTVAVSTVAGWVLLYLRRFVVTAERRELMHARMLRGAERETLRGRVTVTKERVAIRDSITLRQVLVETAEGTRRVKVNDRRAAALSGETGELRLYVANGYIAAFERL